MQNIYEKLGLRGTLGLVYVLGLVFVSVFAPWIAPYSPTEQNPDIILAAPSWAHLLGGDDLGRDVFSRLIYGAAISLYGSALAVGIAFCLGVPIGLLAGFLGGWVDSAISRVIETLMSFPSIVLAIGVTGALGVSATTGMIAIGIVYSPVLARLVRAQTLIIKGELYVDAARSFGARTHQVILRHIVPNAIQPVVVQMTMLLAMALLTQAGLSFLGLGVEPPAASWGAMLARAYTYVSIAPEQAYPPGLAIVASAIAFSSLGEALRTALDPARKT